MQKKFFLRIIVGIMAFSLLTFGSITPTADAAAAGGAPDYSQKASWCKLPNIISKDVDTFYIYSTTYMESSNPLNWKLDETYAPSSKNLGSLIGDEKLGMGKLGDVGADAQINLARGVIVTSAKADPVPMPDFFGPASFHDNDYTFYYNNIRDNVAKRIATYKAG